MGRASGIKIQPEISTVRCWADEAICGHQLPVSFSPPSALESTAPERKQKIQNQLSSMTSAELISNYRNFRETSYGIKQQEKVEEAALVDCQKLSIQEVIRLAGMRFIQMHDPRFAYLSALMLPSGQSISGLSKRDIEEVELVQLLLSAADEVGQQQFDQANAVLSYCEMFSPKQASPVQNVVLYFAQALRERIDKATRIHQVERMLARTDPCSTTDFMLLICHNTLLPHIQITQFAAIQAAVDNTATARRIHVIDLALRSGMHLAVLMQALSERKTEVVDLLKVTAVNTFERGMVEESGRRLAKFAESMGVNLSFNVILVNDIADVKGESFDIEDGEAVVVYGSMALMTMISRQDSLDRLMRVFGTLNPSAMVITEIEANLNAPPFVSRFTDALFFYSSVFDCLDTCMANEKEVKMLMEQHLRQGIKNILSTDGHERTMRSVKIDVWRAFFARHRMVEVGLSESSLNQAKLVAAQHPYGRFSMLKHDGKCLLVGWIGTPLLSLSVWKFR
ncbi:hypothetical protein MLD38_028161 [Melastoma candidum]|uniref:Uncharacterized protein n=1 Tax=Melastoma candidum TaxID=119954 RepID=A0ACB9MZZ8_9MYRT|nr:hypothetical protein MLD38_028161 [Melastoma candidum]